MSEKLAFVDYWKLAEDFFVGALVQRLIPSAGDLSPFIGRVTAVHKGLGFVDVQWPWGNQRLSTDDIVQVNPEFARYLPPSLNFSWYPGYDVTKDNPQKIEFKQASGTPWKTAIFHPDFYVSCAKLWQDGRSEVQAYDELWHKFASRYADEDLRKEVQIIYAISRNAGALRINNHIQRTATYWVARNRQYQVSQAELDSKRPVCPRCKNLLRRTIYKMDKGVRIKLFACPKCLFLIRRESLMGPNGLNVEW